MSADIPGREALSWVRIQDPLHQVPAVITDEIWDRVIGVQDLFVENVSLGVLEGQVATDHRVENDTAGPYVSW